MKDFEGEKYWNLRKGKNMQFLVIHDSGRTTRPSTAAHNELKYHRDRLLTGKRTQGNEVGRVVCLYQAQSKEQLTEWLNRMKLRYENIEYYNDDAAASQQQHRGSA